MQNFEEAFYILRNGRSNQPFGFPGLRMEKGFGLAHLKEVREQLIELYAICTAFQNVIVVCSNGNIRF